MSKVVPRARALARAALFMRESSLVRDVLLVRDADSALLAASEPSIYSAPAAASWRAAFRARNARPKAALSPVQQ